ncbi:putative ABC-type transporter system, ATP-binding component [Nocardia nova SH22a]|uniref:Putative ABC-type transporter system, ATP-binding component n=1 Tax=Nocardia nova SH22a TaxID=1415166 RepID=W5TAW3_9NOCA|nr:ABC transporter ATP-binding protein [Nocardia nova]AHH16337.1 putative ABC-type transporter system, ATP-binding component [Nocardia nova SH22a]
MSGRNGERARAADAGPVSAAPSAEPQLIVDGLDVVFGSGPDRVHAVRDVSFEVHAGECLAVIGESGSGKSVTARTLMGLTDDGATVTARRLEFSGADLRALDEPGWRTLRGRRIALVLQDAMGALDPLRRTGSEIAETLRIHAAAPRGSVDDTVLSLLTDVGVPEPERRARQYPHELSGGLRQRALIASAIAAGPDLLLADEPTTALDATVAAQVLDLLRELRAGGMSILLISHDLTVVSRLADRVAVMFGGRIVEYGPAQRILRDPRHPYTRALLAAVPTGDSRGRYLSGNRDRLSPESRNHSVPESGSHALPDSADGNSPGSRRGPASQNGSGFSPGGEGTSVPEAGSSAPPGGVPNDGGNPASAGAAPSGGCPYASRCLHADEQCARELPPLVVHPARDGDGVRDGRDVRDGRGGHGGHGDDDVRGGYEAHGDIAHDVRCWYPDAVVAAPLRIPFVVPTGSTAAARTLLEVDSIGKSYRVPGGGRQHAVREVSFQLRSGEVLGVVGESGSGKTTTGRIVLGLTRPDTGTVRFDGLPWSELRERRRRPHRRRIQAIYQDALGSFDPRLTVAGILGAAIARGGVPRGPGRRTRALELLDQVGLAATVLDRRPRDLSGGQRQRVGIARALAPGPEILVCDEPVSALDVSVQAQILDLLTSLQHELGVAMLFISHDLGVIHHLSDRILVMKDGRIVEDGEATRVFACPRDPYTRQLLAATAVRSEDPRVSDRPAAPVPS